MSGKLQGKKIAILATDGVEQVELTEPKKALEDAGATTHVVSPKSGHIKAWKFTEWGDDIRVDKTIDQVKPTDYDALHLPGGVINPDTLRIEAKAVAFVKEFVNSGKPTASICHGPWTLIEAGVVKGRKMTSWPSVKTDLSNAGAQWVDEPVVTDQNVTTSRNPDDIPKFNERIIQEFSAARSMKAAS